MSTLVPMKYGEDSLIELRAFVLADREVLIRAINIVCAEGRWMRTLCYEPTPAWEHALAEPDCKCHLLLVAMDEEKIVGWCRAFPDEGGQGAEIALALLLGHRGHGIGQDMLESTVKWAIKLCLTHLRLWTRLDNKRAIRLFQTLEFGQTDRFENEMLEMIRIL
ncbi:MAG: GNAT family N-acetyltransferase [Chloroflexi bacterium]|nr:GNAT family N-acetyltransferase [Chloroflexota bacterium]